MNQQVYLFSRPYVQMQLHTGYNIVERAILYNKIFKIKHRKTATSRIVFGFLDYILKKTLNAPVHYKSESFFYEILVIVKRIFNEVKVIHINSEDTAWLTINFLPSHTFVVVHQPYEWHSKINYSLFSKFKNIICLDNTFYEKLTPSNCNVALIPHPVDSSFFYYKQRVTINNPLEVLIVGTHRRNWEMYMKSISLLNSFYQIRISIVAKKANLPTSFIKFLDNYSSIFLSSISDTDLRSLYHKSDLCLLFCLSSTANNCLLEAASTGTKILINDSDQMKFYLSGYSNYLVFENKLDKLINFIEGEIEFKAPNNLLGPFEVGKRINKFVNQI